MDSLIFWKLLFLLYNLQLGSAIIYNLNTSEYEKMPPVFHLEPYDKCMEDPDAVYCVTELIPVSDTPNELLNMIHEYSAHTTTHFNHSLNRYGICLSSCKHAQDTTVGLRHSLEVCLNETYWRKYRLKIELQENIRCNNAQKDIRLETTDIVFLVILVIILLMNIIGSFCDVYIITPEKNGFGMRLLSLFSIRRNWRKLMSPAAEGPEPRLKKLSAISGVKVIASFLVIFVHILITSAIFVDNPHDVESYYKYYTIQLIANGTMVIQVFFIITGFLLVYNLLLFSEKHHVGWSMLPKFIFLRWIRLTPPYALLILFTVTWIRFLGSGPAWDIAVTDEANDCKMYWWQHLLYINNYNDVSQCFLHTWYLAADTQLYCLGLVVFIACKSPTSRKVVISLLLLAGLIILPLQTYLEDLDGTVIISPETMNHFFANNLTYNHFYKRSLPNLFHYVIGLAAGYIVYHLQEIHFDIQKYKKFRFVIWCLVPMSFGTVWSGCIFYWDQPRPTLLVRLLYAAIVRPAFTCVLFTGFLGIIFRLELMLNFIVESQVWAVMARLSYSGYLLHVTVLRTILGTRTVATHVTVFSMIEQGIFFVLLSYTLAVPYWLLVEQPLGQLFKLFIKPEDAKPPQ